jgi:hypothetical protein
MFSFTLPILSLFSSSPGVQFSERAYSALQGPHGGDDGGEDDHARYSGYSFLGRGGNEGAGRRYGGGEHGGGAGQSSVAHLTAHFLVDPGDVLWFSHCDEVGLH